MAKINFDKLIPLFETQEEFSITESQYEKKIGQPLPKNEYYLKNNSALAKKAKEFGFSLEIKERTICLKKQNI